MNVLAKAQRQSLHRLSKSPSQAPQAPAVGKVDTIALSGAQKQHLEPAAHLERAVQEFQALVATHPSEQLEFAEGAEQLKAVVAEILYGGEWPAKDELPVPSQKKPGESGKNGGLTKSEQLVSDDLVALYRKTYRQATREQNGRLTKAMHACQSHLQGRILRRYHPDYWMSSPGTLQADALREQQRWG